MKGFMQLSEKFKILYIYLNKECDSERQRLKYSLFYTFLLGLLAHAFGLLNLYPSHDTLGAFFYNDQIRWQMSLGRVLSPLYNILTASSGIFLPWSAGMFSLIWIALSIYLVSIIFNMKSYWQIFLLAGIFVTNRSITSLIATYEVWFGADMIALLLAVLSAFFWYKFLQDKQILYLCMGALLLVISMSCYQSYIAVTITLIILYSIVSLLEDKNGKAVFKNGILAIIMIICGGILYYFFMKSICKINNITLAEGDYNNVTNLWNNTEPFFNRIIWCYKQVCLYFSYHISSLYSSNIIFYVNIFLGLVCVYMFFRIIVNRRMKRIELCMIIMLIILLPMGANIIRLLNSEVHDLMVYAVWILYIFPILLWQSYYKEEKRRGVRITLVCGLLLCFIIFNNIQVANAVYVYKKLEYDATISVMTNVLYDIEHQEGYIEGETPVIFIGTPGDCLAVLPFKDKVSNITGVWHNSSVTYLYGGLFTLMERKVNLQSAGELENSEMIQNMPSYPQCGSVKQLNGTIIVKFKKD